MVLICIPLMAIDVEHFFHVSVGRLNVFLEKCLFMSSAHFLTGLLGFLGVEFDKFFIDLDPSPLSDISFAGIFSHSAF